MSHYEPITGPIEEDVTDETGLRGATVETIRVWPGQAVQINCKDRPPVTIQIADYEWPDWLDEAPKM